MGWLSSTKNLVLWSSLQHSSLPKGYGCLALYSWGNKQRFYADVSFLRLLTFFLLFTKIFHICLTVTLKVYAEFCITLYYIVFVFLHMQPTTLAVVHVNFKKVYTSNTVNMSTNATYGELTVSATDVIKRVEDFPRLSQTSN